MIYYFQTYLKDTSESSISYIYYMKCINYYNY